MSGSSPTIDVRPPVSVYATYQRLSYKPWFAIAEFVDNSTENYFEHRKEIQDAFKQNGEHCLTIAITYDSAENSLEIRDNANGMNIEELTRAVVLNKKPPITTGRSEFGMGLKTAACWFGKRWSITTKRLGLGERYCVKVNVEDFADGKTETVPISISPAKPSDHYTIIKIEDLYKPIRTSTHARIKDQLASIYRDDLRSGEVTILWNGVPLEFQNPPILVEKGEDGSKITWCKDVEINVPWDAGKRTLMARGWIGIRIPGSMRDAGLVLMRRGRVIVGGPEAGYKPTEIFGQPNSYSSQRIVGEINMDDWPVTQSKDMFDWSGGLEDDFIKAMLGQCKDYVDKAEGLRVKEKPLTVEDMKAAAEPTAKIMASKKFADAIAAEIEFPTPKKSPEQEKRDIKKIEAVSKGPIVFNMQLKNVQWTFRLHWQDMISDYNWMSVEFPQETQVEIYLNSAHPFFTPYMENRAMLEMLQKFVIAMALAEKLARNASPDANMVEPEALRSYMNRVLLYAAQANAEGQR